MWIDDDYDGNGSTMIIILLAGHEITLGMWVEGSGIRFRLEVTYQPFSNSYEVRPLDVKRSMKIWREIVFGGKY